MLLSEITETAKGRINIPSSLLNSSPLEVAEFIKPHLGLLADTSAMKRIRMGFENDGIWVLRIFLRSNYYNDVRVPVPVHQRSRKYYMRVSELLNCLDYLFDLDATQDNPR